MTFKKSLKPSRIILFSDLKFLFPNSADTLSTTMRSSWSSVTCETESRCPPPQTDLFPLPGLSYHGALLCP